MEKDKKKLSKLNTVLLTVLMLFSLILLFSVMTAKFKGEQARIFGYSFHVVLTDSMTPDINAGDFIIAKKVNKEDIKEGDYIVFITEDPKLNGITIIHKVIGINNIGGEISFQTSGIKEGASPDTYPATEVIGKYVCKSVLLGKVTLFLSRIENILFLALIVTITIIIIKQIKNILKLKKENEKHS